MNVEGRGQKRTRDAQGGNIRYRKRPVDFKPPQQRAGYSSVARARGAAVTGEMKYYDGYLAAATIAASGGADWGVTTRQDPTSAAGVATPLGLFQPTVGAGINQRIGKACKVLKLKLRGAITVAAQPGQSNGDPPANIRLVVVLDKQTNAAQFAPNLLFTGGNAATNTIFAYQNIDNFGRFQVLKDKMFGVANLNMAGSATGGDLVQASQTIRWKFDINFKQPINVRFNATNGGTVADIVDNSFHVLCACSDTGVVSQLIYQFRVCYKE